MNTFDAAPIVAHALAYALLHSLWQGMTLYFVLYIFLKIFGQASARIRYWFAFASLAVTGSWFIYTWVSQYVQLQQAAGHAAASELLHVPLQSVTATPVSHSEISGSLVADNLAHFEKYVPLLLLIYTIGLTFMFCRFLVNIIQLRRLKTHGLLPLAPKYTDMLDRCRSIAGVLRPVNIFLSNRISVPMMLGTMKPMILLPIATINHLSMEQVETILLHELAHIKRNDYLINICQNIVETLLFFNPFIWLMSAIVRREREHCCDDIVLTNAANALPYAKALTILEDNRAQSNLALAATGHRNDLLNRIKRIMEMKKSTMNHSRLTIAVVALIALACVFAMFTITPSFAQKAKGNKNDTAATAKAVYKYRTVTIDSNGKKKVVEKISHKPIDADDQENDQGNTSFNFSFSNDDKSTANTQVYTRITKDSAGHEQMTTRSIMTTGNKNNQADKDGGQMQLDMEQMNSDLKQMNRDLANVDIELKGINWDEIREGLDTDLGKLNKELKGVNWDEIKEDLDNNLKKLDKELSDPNLTQKINIEIKKGMEKSKEALEEAKKEIDEASKVRIKSYAQAGGTPSPGAGPDYDDMLDKMAKDGLIDRRGNYSVVKDHDVLYVNKKKQPAAIYKRYEPYLKDVMVTIKEHDGRKTIKIED